MLKALLLVILFSNSSLQATDSKPASEKEKLIFTIDIIRHGDRTPCADNISTKPYTWPVGLGQLTPLGMRQEYELGEKLRSRYIGKYHLIPPHYEAQTIYVRSTESDRTLMSAESFLMGLYPPGQGPHINGNFFQLALPNAYQPIPIHTVPEDQDALFAPNRNHFDELLTNNVYQTTEWKQKEAEVKPFFPAWSHATGIMITHCDHEFGLLGDALSIRQKKHIPLPPELKQEDANKIVETTNWGMIAMFKNKVVSKTITASLLKKITSYLQQASQQKTALKYVLYSAHDSTILAVASALGAPLDKTPPYASDLNISLFDQGNKNYRVLVTYNDQPLILPCTGMNSCSLEQFLKFVEYTPPTTPLSK